jgi:hypothetical protein
MAAPGIYPLRRLRQHGRLAGECMFIEHFGWRRHACGLFSVATPSVPRAVAFADFAAAACAPGPGCQPGSRLAAARADFVRVLMAIPSASAMAAQMCSMNGVAVGMSAATNGTPVSIHGGCRCI